MKRILLFGALVLVLVTAMAASTLVIAGDNAQDSHKIANKWDASGTLTVSPPLYGHPYDWGGLVPAGETWSYKFHIKEAVDGEFSTGTVHFTSGDIDVVGHVKATKSPYAHWNGYSLPILAAVGTAEYDDISYYFMFIWCPDAIWFALSLTPYDSPWGTEYVWEPKSLRAYELLSTISDNQFTMNPKEIH